MSPYKWLGVALVLICPAWALAQSAPGNRQDISHIAGSIYPTVVLPSRAGALTPPVTVSARAAEVEEDVTAVCIASATDADQCGVHMDAAPAGRSSCATAGSGDDGRGAVGQCHGNDEASHMAYCDVDDVGFAQCLSRYSRALVRHPLAARRSLYVEVRNSQGSGETLTVLATAAATNEQIRAAVRKERPDVTVVAMP